MFLLHQPSAEMTARFLAESRTLPLSYAPVGIAAGTPRGFAVDEAAVTVGSGAAAYERAKHALLTWAHFDLGWVRVLPEGAPVETGTVVAVVVRHFGFWSLNGCRVVAAGDDESGHGFRFAYGTLGNHAEMGEEMFQVSRCPQTDAVSYRIRAVSRPRALLAWCGYPLARRVQARFRADSCRAMQRAVGLDGLEAGRLQRDGPSGSGGETG